MYAQSKQFGCPNRMGQDPRSRPLMFPYAIPTQGGYTAPYNPAILEAQEEIVPGTYPVASVVQDPSTFEAKQEHVMLSTPVIQPTHILKATIPPDVTIDVAQQARFPKKGPIPCPWYEPELVEEKVEQKTNNAQAMQGAGLLALLAGIGFLASQ